MEKVLEILNRMQADGVIQYFAIGGGIAWIYYQEPYLTYDVDVFISPVPLSGAGLVSFSAIYEYLQNLGYPTEREYFRIEGWLVQFLPAAEAVQEEAVAEAKHVAFAGINTLMFSPEHLAAELLRSGRPKDQARVVALIESKRLDQTVFHDIVIRHGLTEKWKRLCEHFGLEK